MGNLNENIVDLKRLLGAKLVTGKINTNHPLRQCILRILEFHHKGDIVSRDEENALLSSLVKNLKEIEAYDRVLFGTIKKTLIQSDYDSYFGVRFEISVAASLIRSAISFQKSESPDFLLADEFAGACIECGSAHLSKPKPGIDDLKYKIGAVSFDKSKHGYCHRGTGLFIDLTNINYHSLNNSIIPSVEEWRGYLSEVLDKTQFGSIILWTYIINMNANRYQWKYTRVDSTTPSPQLKAFLDKAYPFGRDVTHTYIFPEQG